MDNQTLFEIKELMRRPASPELLTYVSNQAGLVIPCFEKSPAYLSEGKYGVLPPLTSFIEFLVKRSSARAGTLLACLVFLQRLHNKLATIAKGMPCTAHRIFLATLIVTSKAIHDTSPKNKHWAKYATYFNLYEINLMEKQLLTLMDYNVIIPPNEFMDTYRRFKYSRYSQVSPTISLAKPSPAALLLQQTINDADIPSYAAMYSNSAQCNLPPINSANLNGARHDGFYGLPSLSSNLSDSSFSSFSSSSDSIATLEEMPELKQFSEPYPPKAHCRIRKISEYKSFLDHQ